MIILSLMNLWYLKIIRYITSSFSLYPYHTFDHEFEITQVRGIYMVYRRFNNYNIPVLNWVSNGEVEYVFDSRESAVEYLYRKYGENIVIK